VACCWNNLLRLLLRIWIYQRILYGCKFLSLTHAHTSFHFLLQVNIGYSIGWNYPATPNDSPTLLFSIGFEFLGSSAVAYSLQIFAECVLLDDRAWYVKALKREQHEVDRKSDDWKVKFRSWVESQSENLIPFCLCILWLCGGGLVAWFYIQHWTAYESVYFAFSSLATGGQIEIPEDSPTRYYLIGAFYSSFPSPPQTQLISRPVVALYSAIGTPLMAYTLGSIASLFIVGPNIKVLEVIEKKITYDDLRTMQKYGLENRDGAMDRAEYLILCMLRLGVVDPELVQAIVNRYDELDLSGDGLLSYKELLEQDDACEKGRGMRVTIKRKDTRDLTSRALTKSNSRDLEAEYTSVKKRRGQDYHESDPEDGDDDSDSDFGSGVVLQLQPRKVSPTGRSESETKTKQSQPQAERSQDPLRPPVGVPPDAPPPRPSIEKGRSISAKVSSQLAIQKQRAREKSFSGRPSSSLNSPIRPLPLSPGITRQRSAKSKSRNPNLSQLEAGLSFSQPRLATSSASTRLNHQRPPSPTGLDRSFLYPQTPSQRNFNASTSAQQRSGS
jgi:hypothetical protein